MVKSGNKKITNKNKNKKQIAGFDEIANDDIKGTAMGNATYSGNNKGEEDTMTTGQEPIKHNLIEIDEEVTVTVDGIADMFTTVVEEENNPADQEIIDELTKGKEDKGEEPGLTIDGEVHTFRANLIGEAFSLVAQDLADKHKSGKELPGRKKIKNKVIKKAAELAMKHPDYSKIIKDGGGTEVFAEELEETFNYPAILDKYEKLIDHLIFTINGIAEGTISTPKDEPKIPVAPKTKEDEVVTDEPIPAPVIDEGKTEEPLIFFTTTDDKDDESKSEVTSKPTEPKKPYKTMREQMLEQWEKEKAQKAVKPAKEEVKVETPEPKPESKPVKPKKKEETISTQAQYIFANKKPRSVYSA